MYRSAVLLSFVLVIACNSRSTTEPVQPVNAVVVTRADGSTVPFAQNVWAWCAPWETGVVAEPTIHVLVGSAAARWEFRAVRRDIRVGDTMTFPNTFIWDQPRHVDMFVHDPPNELSTQTGGSTGGVVIQHADCGAGGGIRFSVNATIGSEFGDLPPVTVTGTFASPWTAPPGTDG